MAAAKQKTSAKKAAKPAKSKAKETGYLNIDDVRSKTPDQLKDLLLGFKKETFNMRFQKATGEAGAPARARSIRRNVAKIKTVLNEQKLSKNTGEQKNA